MFIVLLILTWIVGLAVLTSPYWLSYKEQEAAHSRRFAECSAISFGLLTLLFFPIWTWVFCLLLGVGLEVAWRRGVHRGWSLDKFRGVALGLTVTMGLVCFSILSGRIAEIQGLALRYPTVSLKSRLEYEDRSAKTNQSIESVSNESQRPAAALTGELEAWMRYLADQEMPRRRPHELRALKGLDELSAIHNGYLRNFSLAPGFGILRVAGYRPTSEVIDVPEPMVWEEAKLLTSSRAEGGGFESFAPKDSREAESPRDEYSSPYPNGDVLGQAHLLEWVDFGHPHGYGSDGSWRGSATGFLPHRLDRTPHLRAPYRTILWEVSQIQLVSLMKHDPPAVYVTSDLPDMERLRSEDFPTRPLDEFETESLERMRDGEFLVVDRSEERLRMFGALPATMQCTTCHHVEEGALLGAFSYVLRPTGRVTD